MTEQEWLTTKRPWLMFDDIHSSRPSERKVRLFDAAICRRFWDHLPASSQAILSESEALADGLVQATDEMALCWRANEVVAPFDRQLRELPGLDEAELDQFVPHPHPFAKTKLLALLWCAHHEMLHAGQIGLLRRHLGYPPIW
jgi:uncharacterized damage-inducible protein DinB